MLTPAKPPRSQQGTRRAEIRDISLLWRCAWRSADRCDDGMGCQQLSLQLSTGTSRAKLRFSAVATRFAKEPAAT